MTRRKYAPEWALKRVEEYLSGKGTYEEIARTNGFNSWTLRQWVNKYREHGAAAFAIYKGNAHYSKEFKIRCVEAVISGERTLNEVVAKNNISSKKILKGWVKRYNANRELKDYDPKPEVYMAESRRKTTQEERREIVEYCLSHGKDYKNTASRYDVSYSQVYSWVRKYSTEGVSGLEDRRGHHKSDDEVDEMERLRRENIRLKRQLEEKDMLVELLKKVKEFEGK